MKNLGGFEKIYPVSEEMILKIEEEKAQEQMRYKVNVYEHIKEHAKELFSN